MLSSLQKSNRLLQIFLGAFLLIAFRIWHLAVIQRDEKLLEAQKPQRRTIIEQAERGSITDRFGIPLAVNRICYNATVYYSQLAQIPSVVWTTDENGQKLRETLRKDAIRDLAKLLGSELSMDPERIEDLIHSKASLFPHVPFIIRQHLTEQQYYRLKGREREYPGLHAQISLERNYPLGKTAASVIGHLGSISPKEYLDIAKEIDLLQQMISEGSEEESLVSRYQELKEKAYTINDLVGKAGIEKQYEEELRGFYGKTTFEIDQKGNCLRELPGSKPSFSGQTVVLSLSAELQQFCEQLLIKNEKTRENRSTGIDPATKNHKVFKQPYIKGGAIVALDPKNGEVLAMAGFPRFDPNDFITSSDRVEKMHRIRRWQESDRYIADLWDGKESFYREGVRQDETPMLTWETYLQWTLPADSPIYSLWSRLDDIRSAIQMQEDFEALLYFANNPEPENLIDLLFHMDKPMSAALSAKDAALQELQKNSHEAMPHWRRLEAMLGQIPSNADKLFAIDLSRIAIYAPAFTDELIHEIGSMKIAQYYTLSQSLHRVEVVVKAHSQKIFHSTEFRAWKAANQKEFLHQKRQVEKEKKSYAHPYIDYLDQKEKELFEEFWQKIRLPLLASLYKQSPSFLPPDAQSYFDASLANLPDWSQLRSVAVSNDQIMQWLKTMRSYSELQRPLLGSYRALRGRLGQQIEQNLAAAFYPIGGFGYSRSHTFQSAAPLGSIFKLVTATEAMRQKGSNTSPLTLIDEVRFDDKDHSLIVASSTDHKPYYRHYKGGRLPRSHLPQLGKVDIIGAIEQSSNPYFAILAGDYLNDPEDLARAAGDFGLGERTGIDLPGELKGHLPTDLKKNRTGLYSFAIGQHTLVTTPLQVAVMLQSLANGGKVLAPKLARSIEGVPSPVSPLCDSMNAFLAEDELAMLGIDFPLFTASSMSVKTNEKAFVEARLKRSIDLPHSIRNTLFEGMDRVVWGPLGNARPSAIKGLSSHPELLQDFLSLQHQMIGKTSTAEISCRLDMNPSSVSHIYKHIWFGGIAFPLSETHRNRFENPELVVVVYLRYGDGGKEAAPLAAQIIRKWREIQSRHQQSSTMNCSAKCASGSNNDHRSDAHSSNASDR